MRFFFFLLLFWFIFSSNSIQAQHLSKKALQKQNLEMKKKQRERALELLRLYNPEGLEIVLLYEQAPKKFSFPGHVINFNENKDFTQFFEGDSDKQIIDDLGSVVHEMSHGFIRVMAYDYMLRNGLPSTDTYHFYYLSHTEQIPVKLSPVFPSSKLAGSIPEKMQTFRYKTYIEGNSSTQDEGVYGLLNELVCYYHDSKTSFFLHNYYTDNNQTSPDYWLDYISTNESTMHAYLEFTYYILKYIQYAKENEPAVYKGIMRNTNFKFVFNSVETKFVQLRNEYYMIRTKIADRFQSRGLNVHIDDEFYTIGPRSIGIFRAEYKYIEAELKKPEMQELLESLK
jgi:hypothetical protein